MRAKDKQKILKTVDKLVEYNKTLEKYRGSSKYLFDNAILDDLKNFLNSKNIKQWSLFNKI